MYTYEFWLCCSRFTKDQKYRKVMCENCIEGDASRVKGLDPEPKRIPEAFITGFATAAVVISVVGLGSLVLIGGC